MQRGGDEAHVEELFGEDLHAVGVVDEDEGAVLCDVLCVVLCVVWCGVLCEGMAGLERKGGRE